MIPLKSPITTSRTRIGFTVRGYTDFLNFEVPGAGTVTAHIRIHYEDGSYEDTAYTLWDGADTPAVVADNVELAPGVAKAYKYADAAQWTDKSAEARITEILEEGS